MTDKQTKYYWRAWAAAHRADPAADRHELTLRALGKTVSSKDLTNREFDRVLAAFAAVSNPDSVNAQMRQSSMPRTRALHTIRKAPAEYVQALCADRFGTRNYESLSDPELMQLAMTLNHRKNATVGRVPSPGVPIDNSLVSYADLADAESAMQSAPSLPSALSPLPSAFSDPANYPY